MIDDRSRQRFGREGATWHDMHQNLHYPIIFLACFTGLVRAETLKRPLSLEQQLKAVDAALLAKEAQTRGDVRRGALVFYRSAAACQNCHSSGEKTSPLGPDLATIGKTAWGEPVSDEYLINALLHPSHDIRKGFETKSILTSDGVVINGLVAREDSEHVTLRDATDLAKETVISKANIERVSISDKSMMPEGLVAVLEDQRQFLDLARYVIEVARGGPERAAELKPSADQLVIADDSANLDHAGIIKRFRSRDFEAGQKIYHGYCFNCHGNDGNTPSLPTARAFGTQKMKYGADPFRMFMTLTRGNGLMAPMSHLTPKERYQVVHYIREQFMKPTNPDYFKVDDEYLASLPEGTEDGTEIANVERNFGPALASQLERKFSSVLTVDLGGTTISYDLQTMNQAGLGRDGFLDLSNTQHVRPRGEGTANPNGPVITGLRGWRWGHEGRLDYSREGLRPRGPLPIEWMNYRGHYLHGDQLILSYEIDGREILESPRAGELPNSIRHSLRIGPGKGLVLSAAALPENVEQVVVAFDKNQPGSRRGKASEGMAMSGKPDENGMLGEFTAAGVFGDIDGMTWSVDEKHRIRLEIPADDQTRAVEVVRFSGNGDSAMLGFKDSIESRQRETIELELESLTRGGPLLWPDVLTTVGYPGLEQGAYALDTITIPESTPWNTWFRTSALDFLSDGRMVVATHGGDIWIVSGLDADLMELKWKRFAGGLYEPFGVKVVDDKIYVTCKDRITRLHDQDANGEADFYESLSADTDVSVNFHAFNFDLQTDDDGNFYYAKSGHGADFSLPGAVVKVSPDGAERSVYCTGFRTPNGMGSMPGGRLTASDNQGQWTPASKVNLLRPGGFYGWVANYSIPGKWQPDGGRIDLEKVVPPESFDPPLVWMPQEFDNSSGGQLWVDDPRWGPLSERLLHTSFGKGWMYYMMIQDFDDLSQAAIIKLPFDFSTGIMRARVNPVDGQVYATGLQGWNGGARLGLKEKGIQRLRYTGKALMMVSDCQVESDGLRLSFNFALDPDMAADLSSYDVQHWNYHWRKEYGSDMFSPSTDQPGKERMNVDSATLDADGKSVKLRIWDLKPVNQVHLLLKLKAQDGEPFEEEIYWTINRVPKAN